MPLKKQQLCQLDIILILELQVICFCLLSNNSEQKLLGRWVSVGGGLNKQSHLPFYHISQLEGQRNVLKYASAKYFL